MLRGSCGGGGENGDDSMQISNGVYRLSARCKLKVGGANYFGFYGNEWRIFVRTFSRLSKDVSKG